ncbi:MAG: Stk1 family PASTA domain-containing Ser/Thr kinase [Clostridia bacterium]|nr:Stk1 family PASTA domain-containing Ser/Thr kinase [Clostridia bacterium]
METYVNKRIDNRYEVLEIIGVGGMAVVYKAYDSIDDRVVAIKILKEEYLANEEFRRRFKNESKYIAVLSHPNIVKVYDMSFGDRLQYIVMEFIEGITLKEYIEQQKVIQPKEAVHFVTQILRALQHAHDKGIVHRDIKPQNIMLLKNGSIKVTDFGIASFSRSESATIAENSAIGSVHYISPEQARGDFTDAKADIYSVGVLMYEMLTGKLPFTSENPISVVMMHMNDEPANMHDINGSIPVGLEQITMHAMQKDPKARYQSAAELLLDLDEFKRNPSIKFDYSYFVDNEPTKYIDRTMNINGSGDKSTKSNAETSADNDDDSVKNNSKLIPILTGVVSGCVAVLLVVGLVLLLFTDAFLASDRVPNFMNMNYETEIKDNDKYNEYKIQVEYEFNTQYEYGVVIRQSPQKGKKIGKDEYIYITVNTNKTAPVSDVYGQPYLSAKQTLEASGFITKYEMLYEPSVEEGSVIRTSPERGDSAAVGSTITIYISTHTDEDAVFVPKLVGFTPEEANELAKSVGLVIGQVIQVDSLDNAGKVIEQVPAENETAHPGDKVDIYVSTGNPPVVTIELSIPLPYKSGNAGALKVYLNNASVESAGAEVLLTGSNYTFNVSGSGASNTLIVKIDGSTVYSCNIDFTTDPVTLTNVKTVNDEYDDSLISIPLNIIPEVVGLSEAEAMDLLSAQGFINVTVEYKKTTDVSHIGYVIEQTPELSGLDKYRPYSIDTAIVIFVGEGVF